MRTVLSQIDDRGFLPHLHRALRNVQTGVLRLRRERATGAIWFVRREIVHALMIEGKLHQEGLGALEFMGRWTEGSAFVEAGVLPPARTIRLPVATVLSGIAACRKRTAAPDLPAVKDSLAAVLETLRQRIPGLESLSVMRGSTIERTTSQNLAEHQWLDRQVRFHWEEQETKPETLLLQEGDMSALFMKSGDRTTILSARASTAPEALLWAADQLRQRWPMTVEDPQEER